MIAPRHLPLGDGVISGQGKGEATGMNHHDHMGSSTVTGEHQRSRGNVAAEGIVDHNMQELEWEEGWYENDLHLAAELGKTLLERNKELESNVLTAQQENEEQAMQIVYLEKQLQVLRDVTESKAHVYEQLDLNSQELEKTNHRLEHELRTAQQRIMRTTETIEGLESKSQEQQHQIDALRAAERDRLKEGRRQKKIIEALGNTHGYPMRRARSFDLGRVTGDSVFEDEIVNLSVTIRNLKERLKSKDAEQNVVVSEMEVLLKENQVLEEKVHKLEVKSQMKEIEQDYSSLNKTNEAVCKYCDALINAEEVEEADDKGKLSAQGGRGSQDLGTIAEVQEVQNSEDNDAGQKGEGLSLFSEIDNQYHELMDKYNSLLTRSRSGSFRDETGRPRAGSIRGRKVDSGVQTSTHTTPVPTPTDEGACVVDAHFTDGPPEYKSLFKDIFTILHRRPSASFKNRPEKFDGLSKNKHEKEEDKARSKLEKDEDKSRKTQEKRDEEQSRHTDDKHEDKSKMKQDKHEDKSKTKQDKLEEKAKNKQDKHEDKLKTKQEKHEDKLKTKQEKHDAKPPKSPGRFRNKRGKQNKSKNKQDKQGNK